MSASVISFFAAIGVRIDRLNGTSFPDSNIRPQTTSSTFTAYKYLESTTIIFNHDPANSGCGGNGITPRKPLTPNTTNTNPRKIRATMTAHFMAEPFP